jgi:hypothetical protein
LEHLVRIHTLVPRNRALFNHTSGPRPCRACDAPSARHGPLEGCCGLACCAQQIDLHARCIGVTACWWAVGTHGHTKRRVLGVKQRGTYDTEKWGVK